MFPTVPTEKKVKRENTLKFKGSGGKSQAEITAFGRQKVAAMLWYVYEGETISCMFEYIIDYPVWQRQAKHCRHLMVLCFGICAMSMHHGEIVQCLNGMRLSHGS